MSEFTVNVLRERARLALLDPEGEHGCLTAPADTRATWEPSELPIEHGPIPRLSEPERYPFESDPGALHPVCGIRPRQILLHFEEPGPVVFHISGPGATLDPRDLLDRLGVDPAREHGMVRCPAHEDRAASLSWRWTGDKALLHCMAGCTFDEIRAAL